MEASSTNFPHEIEPSKNIHLFNIGKNIASLISDYLTDKDLVNLCMVSHRMHSLFHPSLEKRLMSHFLRCVVEGRLDKAEEILTKNKKLVFLRGNITDLSGRIFTRITAFQYTIWALDKEMWELILRYLPQAQAYEQLVAFEQERHDITQIHGKCFNFAPLLEAYQNYIDNYDRWNNSERQAFWCKEVGGAQRQMPAWFVYVFCETGEDGAWPIEDFKKGFTRDPKHLSWWFEQEYSRGKLGVAWAASRAGLKRPRWAGGATTLALAAAPRDRGTTSQFMKGRTNELSELVERLSEKYGGEKNLAPTSNNFGK